MKTKILGSRVVIRTTTVADIPELMALWNDGRVMKWVGFPNGLGWDIIKMKDWFKWIQISFDRINGIFWI
jgi:hypothetical protein